MINQTFTYKDGIRPNKAVKEQNEALKAEATKYVKSFTAKNQRPPTQAELAQKLKITPYKAGNVLLVLRRAGVIEKRGRQDKQKLYNIHSGALVYVVCSECGEQTCARSAQSETLRGWTHVNMVGRVGVCHKCSKGAK